jgi:glycosyltransferase involved in cell wall biosynthesis
MGQINPAKSSSHKKPLVSVIVTSKNEECNISHCLRSIRNQSYKVVEIIVVDNNSTDGTKRIAYKYTDNIFNFGPERSAQRNFGAKKAKGDYLLFLDSDMELSETVIEECVQKSWKKVITGIIIPEESRGEGFWAKCKALERSFYDGIDWIEAPRYFPKKIFDEFKGYDEEQTGTEDYDFPQRIKKKKKNDCFDRINSKIYHNEGKLSLINSLKKKNYYAKTSDKYFSKVNNVDYFKKQASILERYRLFFSDYKRLFSNPSLGIGMLFMKTAEFVAGGIGYLFR